MRLKVVRFLSLLFTALGLGPGMAHALALPNKINLPAEEYRTVQQIYRVATAAPIAGLLFKLTKNAAGASIIELGQGAGAYTFE